jgi:hypothetical protein
MNEQWKDIKDYEGLYMISNTGKVKSLSRQRSESQPHIITKEKLLKPLTNMDGYLQVILTKNRIHKIYTIHRLVANAFILPVENKNFINHKDTNKLNNNDWNLEWCTAKENTEHAMNNNLMDWSKVCKGEKHGRHKLNELQVKEIKSKLIEYSDTELSKQYNINRTTIWQIRKGINWK